MADSRHKRDTNARFLSRFTGTSRLAAPIAIVATLGVVAIGVGTTAPVEGDSARLTAGSALTASFDAAIKERDAVVSRSAPAPQVQASGPKLAIDQERQRRIETAKAVSGADTKLWVTTNLNLWSAASGGENLGLLEDGKQVLVTGRKNSGRTEVVAGGKSRWVTSGHLSADKPQVEVATDSADGSSDDAAPAAGGSCTNGTSVSGGANVIKVHQAVCAAFPSITTYGTYRGDGEHAQGLAIDIMVSGGTGWQVAEFVRANQAQLGVSYAIYSQKIWSVQRSGEGWRGMSDRGSTTANHYDHVHVTTY